MGEARGVKLDLVDHGKVFGGGLAKKWPIFVILAAEKITI